MRRWTAGLTTLAAAGLLATGLAGTAQAAYPGADGLIAFVRGGNIYTINPESTTPGGTIVRLTAGGHDAGPRWSPDGQQIAYLDRGNLWVMNANGSHKARITDQAPGYTDSRPSWSPNGRYLAFVKTKRGVKYGYLTRYDTVTRKFATFSTPYHSEAPTRRQIKVTALPGAVAWTWTPNGDTHGSFIIFQGATAPACPANRSCLDLLGFPAQSDYRNGFPSAENEKARPVQQIDPDWYPINPLYYQDALTTQERCHAGHCTYQGINMTVTSAPVLPGAYEAVHSPSGFYIAYVKNTRSGPGIYIYNPPGIVPMRTRELTIGTEPDWQPVEVTA
ncbi:MAG TPA: DPP IV N-terminal domain-containing protein [Streptosporangiaceae bacterium]|jgi:hypothetical protein|nr:DPP IV N-terminal domain-containing protein [Streptosporangiaceae bacterium]